jgi:hypothetical protein
MNATHRNHTANIYSCLEALNTATSCRYTVRCEDTDYVLVGPYGEYDAQPAFETVQRLTTMRLAATGRTRS